MKSIFVRGINVDTEDGIMNLNYYRIEQESKVPDVISYGVKVEMMYDDKSESKTVYNVFSVRCYIDEFIDVLARNSVTPVTLEEITRGYISDMMYVR